MELNINRPKRASAVILKTNEGVRLFGSMQVCNGTWMNAENCFKYCNMESEAMAANQARKLIYNSTKLGYDEVSADDDWYRNRANFLDVSIPYYCNQEYTSSLPKED